MRTKKISSIILFAVFAVAVFSTISIASRMMDGGMMGGGQGERKMCSMMGRMPKTGVDPKNLPDADSDAAKAYSKFCSQCHALPGPKRNSAEDWKTLVDRMDSRMQMMSRMGGGMKGMMRKMMMGRGKVEAMSSSEKKMVIAYLQKHSLRTLDKSTVSLDTPEFRAFEKICSRCHDLPDPSLYTKSDWPQVVQKMKNNMKEMELAEPSAEEEKSLLRFLQGAAGS